MRTPKIVVLLMVVTGLGFAAGYGMVDRWLQQQAAGFARQQAAWQVEKSGLEADLASARSHAATAAVAAPAQVVTVTNKVSPEAILARLKTMKALAGDLRSSRLLVHQFENLVDAGPAALPAIRAFLARNEDMEYDAEFVRGSRDGKIATEFNVPPSLRLSLFEAVKHIGGVAAETVLAEVLKSTGRGIEVAYLARALQEMAPDQYRAAALATARELLTTPLADPADPLAKFDRNYLFGVFAFFNDNSAADLARAGLVMANGQIDQVALRYLEQSLGTQSVALAAQLWQDSRIAPDQKEPVARMALAYAGADTQANQLFNTAINDQNLSPAARRNLIEDLNQDGFPDRKNLTAADLPLIQNRLKLIEQWAPASMDQINARAFQEAAKDLKGMHNKIMAAQAINH